MYQLIQVLFPPQPTVQVRLRNQALTYSQADKRSTLAEPYCHVREHPLRISNPKKCPQRFPMDEKLGKEGREASV